MDTSPPAKKVIGTRQAPARHWVGDGFPVHSMFDYGGNTQALSPFLLLDYASPTSFDPLPAGTPRRGVGTHPHRGFETVTIVYAGEVEHRDSTGKGGVIGPGDVQWMTAGSGILHQEFHSGAYSERGGPFEMVQLWVNLPARDKMTPPGYQAITDGQIPQVALPGGGRLRLIAGAYGAERGPASTYTPMNVWDVRLVPGERADLPQPDGWTTAVVVLAGEALVNGQALKAAQMATLGTAGAGVTIEAGQGGEAKLLLLAGEPIAEPVVGYGPFVMNSPQEIAQAIADFNAGKFGRMQ
jgi:redox-sensitive bicupin YhaK (pirin superfamily)